LDDNFSGIHGGQSQEKGERSVKGEAKPFLLLGQHERVMGESGKGGESSAESHGQEKAQFGREKVPLLGEAVHYPQEKTARQVHHKGAPGEKGSEVQLEIPGNQISGDAPEEPAKTNKCQRLNHFQYGLWVTRDVLSLNPGPGTLRQTLLPDTKLAAFHTFPHRNTLFYSAGIGDSGSKPRIFNNSLRKFSGGRDSGEKVTVTFVTIKISNIIIHMDDGPYHQQTRVFTCG